MNKKTIKLTLLSLSFSFLIGCNNTPAESTNINSSEEISIESSDNSSFDNTPKLKEMLEAISVSNITYHSDYYIYYYSIKSPKNLIDLQRFDIFAKITEELYDMTAYHYGEDLIASYAHLERDEEGYVTYSDININNELVTNHAIDGTGNSFLWEESVYYNMIKYLSADDFEKIDENTYNYTGDLTKLPVTIIHTGVPLTSFNLESFIINIVEDKIASFVFQEVESDEAYEDSMYGRRITMRFEDIGSTSIERIKPYEEKEENVDLGSAIKYMQGKDNYTITSVGVLEDGSIMDFQKTYVTKTDILQVQQTDEGEFKTGCHTYNGKLYTFETSGKYLLGEKAQSDITVSSFLPTFNFSKDVFEYIGKDDKYGKIYRPYQNMKGVLDFVDVISQYSEAYYSPAGDINFFVKNGRITKIEFPVYVYSSANPLIATNRLSFDNVGSTTIPSGTWSSFVTEIPNVNITSWDDENYNFKFELSSTNKVETSIVEVFEKCLGNSSSIPYFLPSSALLSVSGNYSETDNVVYISLFGKNYDEEILTYANEILTSAGFTYTYSGDDMFNIQTYEKDDIKIDFVVIAQDNALEIVLVLPVGNIFELN